MVFIQHFARVFQVELVLAIYAPRHGSGPVQVVACDRVFRRTGFQDRQLVHLFADAFLRLGRQHFAHQALLELFDVGAAVILGQAQLLLDDLELFLEEELALMLTDLAVYLGGDFLLQARDFNFLAQHRQYFSMRLSMGTQSSTSCNSLPVAEVNAAAKSVSGDGSLGLKRLR